VTLVDADRALGQVAPSGPEPPHVPQGRFSVTPFIGWRAPVAQDRREVVIVPGHLLPLAVEVEARPAGGGVAGVETELRIAGAVGVNAALAFSNPENRILSAETPEGSYTQASFRGPSLWFARAGLSIRLPEPSPDTRAHRPAAYLMLGPGLVREVYGDGPLALPDRNDRLDSWALHMGARAILPIGMPGLFILLAAENYATLWNPNDGELARMERAMQLQPGTLLNASLGANRTHLLMFSLGLSIRV
jgi:hypothetical protein